jgi:hypothetical protein
MIIAAGGAAISVLTEAGTIGKAGLWVVVLTGIIAAAKDVQAAFMEPPRF